MGQKRKISRSTSLTMVLTVALFALVALDMSSIPKEQNSSPLNNKKMSLKEKNQEYVPSPIEKYLLENTEQQVKFSSANNPSVCNIWKDPNATGPEIHKSLVAYAADLDKYNEAVKNYKSVKFDIVKHLQTGNNRDVCADLKLHPDGLSALFPSMQLSLSKAGWIEPLTPPMRFHKFCWDGRKLMSLEYLVHDFEAMCHNLKATSKKVLIDMGASLSFHGNTDQPIVTLLQLYEKFGFHFDHIYGFEITPFDSTNVYKNLLPEKYFAAYHWINTGVSSGEEDQMNPLYSILQKFSEDDFIVVKLDIDTPQIELPLATQVLRGGPNGVYHKLIDQFYFEHHVHLGELAGAWSWTMNGTIKESLDLFYGLREKGIASHFWP